MSSMLLYGSLIFATAFSGGAIPLLIPAFRDELLKHFVALGAGLLLGMAVLHMLPEAVHLLPDSFAIWFLAGFLILFVLERFIMVHACEETHCHYHTIGIAAFAGLAVHGLIEGFALASTLIATQVGPLVLLAILAHKVPAGVALTSILRLGDRNAKQILLFVSGVALSGPIGLVLAYGILSHEQVSAPAGILLSMSAGTFLYIAACDLIPEVHRTDKDKGLRLALFFVGIALAWLSERLLG
jgi:zinc and cadmium transporter